MKNQTGKKLYNSKLVTQNTIFLLIGRTVSGLFQLILFAVASITGFLLMPADFAIGILCGGLLVTANFHLLARTLKKALTPPHLASHNVVIAKYFYAFYCQWIYNFHPYCRSFCKSIRAYYRTFGCGFQYHACDPVRT